MEQRKGCIFDLFLYKKTIELQRASETSKTRSASISERERTNSTCPEQSGTRQSIAKFITCAFVSDAFQACLTSAFTNIEIRHKKADQSLHTNPRSTCSRRRARVRRPRTCRQAYSRQHTFSSAAKFYTDRSSLP